MKKIVIANLKMNQTASQTKDYMVDLVAAVKESKCEIVVCPPFTSLSKAKSICKKTNVALGGQNFHYEESGAHTGEISAPMLKELGVTYVIVGHSERRKEFGETNQIVNKKIKSAMKNNLKVVFCVGESLTQRNTGKTESVLKTQIEQGLEGLYENELDNVIIAYEPIWAIGTGKVATEKQIAEVMALIRRIIKENFSAKAANHILIVYGGSVNKQNSKKIFATKGVDGALVGGASLDVAHFVEIIGK